MRGGDWSLTMDDVPSILIVDSNVGFATMLQQSLEQNGEYSATVAHDGTQALEAASQEMFDLAIVDLGVDVVDDLDGATIARKLRERQSGLRLMLIPLAGDVLSEELADLDVQGTLPKPFFLPDLPDLLQAAMTKPMATVVAPTEAVEPVEAPRQPPAPVEALRASPKCSPTAIGEMESLAQEINAAAVLLTRGEEVLGSVGWLRPEDVSELARIVAQSHRISSQVGEILGREQRHFEQSIEGDQQILYSLTVAEDVILSAALRSDVPLGILRHRVRSAAKRLRTFLA
jgi:CheY-like chemotaxis protein